MLMDDDTEFGDSFPIQSSERHSRHYILDGDYDAMGHGGSASPAQNATLGELPRGPVSRGGSRWIDLGIAMRGAA